MNQLSCVLVPQKVCLCRSFSFHLIGTQGPVRRLQAEPPGPGDGEEGRMECLMEFLQTKHIDLQLADSFERVRR
ncbi:MAG: hypothetical protein ACLQEQ_02840 [Nitrososphaerales archaeon]